MAYVRILGGIILCTVLAPLGYAQNSFMSYGIGNRTCGSLVLTFAPGTSNVYDVTLYESWLQGFFSSWNLLTAVEHTSKGDLAHIANADGLTEWVRSYCAKNPTKLISWAAQECAHTFSKIDKKK